MINILMVDDDEDDRLLFEDVIKETSLLCQLHNAVDGQDMFDKLQATSNAELPDLILLDLNMPRMDVREALEKIKSDPRLRLIPVVILTTSNAETDIIKSYDCGASSYIPKPVTFDELTEKIIALTDYWFDVVRLPDKK